MKNLNSGGTKSGKVNKNSDILKLQKETQSYFKQIDNLWISKLQKLLLKHKVFLFYLKSKRKVIKKYD